MYLQRFHTFGLNYIVLLINKLGGTKCSKIMAQLIKNLNAKSVK